MIIPGDGEGVVAFRGTSAKTTHVIPRASSSRTVPGTFTGEISFLSLPGFVTYFPEYFASSGLSSGPSATTRTSSGVSGVPPVLRSRHHSVAAST
jgi:hypothetical protein